MDSDELQELATKWQLRTRVLTLESTLTNQGKRMDELVRDARQTVKRIQAAHERLDELRDNDAVLANMLERLESLEVGHKELAEKVNVMGDWIKRKLGNGGVK